jgi:hypothetical protein
MSRGLFKTLEDVKNNGGLGLSDPAMGRISQQVMTLLGRALKLLRRSTEDLYDYLMDIWKPNHRSRH